MFEQSGEYCPFEHPQAGSRGASSPSKAAAESEPCIETVGEQRLADATPASHDNSSVAVETEMHVPVKSQTTIEASSTALTTAAMEPEVVRIDS